VYLHQLTSDATIASSSRPAFFKYTARAAGLVLTAIINKTVKKIPVVTTAGPRDVESEVMVMMLGRDRIFEYCQKVNCGFHKLKGRDSWGSHTWKETICLGFRAYYSKNAPFGLTQASLTATTKLPNSMK